MDATNLIFSRTLRIVITEICLPKDGAYYCYCAYVLCILRNSGFLSVNLTNRPNA